MDNSLEMNMPNIPKWKKEEELILKEWADKAVCYKWLHLKSHERFRSINAYYTIPVIILSTITGTANFAQDRVPAAFLSYYVMTVGALNLIAGIISTIHQYLKIAEINESHRVAYIAWDKFARNIRIELIKNPKVIPKINLYYNIIANFIIYCSIFVYSKNVINVFITKAIYADIPRN